MHSVSSTRYPISRYQVLLAGMVFTWMLTFGSWKVLAQDYGPPGMYENTGITVTGRGELLVPPDMAVIRMGAVAEDKEAAVAQRKVNEIIRRALAAFGTLNIPTQRVKTIGLTLSPIYDQQERRQNTNTGQRIIGYRAHNTIQVEMMELDRVGQTIDAAVGAGANQVENLSFQLRDDAASRREALRQASLQAQAKAETIAEALRVRIIGVREVVEGGVNVIQPRIDLAQARFSAVAGQPAPVEPGDVQVEAVVTIRYDLGPIGAGAVPAAGSGGTR